MTQKKGKASRATAPGLQERVLQAMQTHCSGSPGTGILLAVSGGADSMALLLAMASAAKKLRCRLVVAHLNHGIRGATAGADVEFVKKAAEALALDCVIGRRNVPDMARRSGESIEMAARRARYDFLLKTAAAKNCRILATAHNADDQAETLLLRFIRGAGSRGLAGIARVSYRKNMVILRPLLDVTRKEIENFLRRKRQTWREDESNSDTSFQRNRVRLDILPLLEKTLNPNIRAALRRTADIMQQENSWFEGIARELLDDCIKSSGAKNALPIAGLKSMPLAACRRVLIAWLRDNDLPDESLDFETVERARNMLFAGASARAVALPGGMEIRREGEHLLFQQTAGPDKKTKQNIAVDLKLPCNIRLPKLGIAVCAALAPGIAKETKGMPGCLPACASLDPQAIGKSRLVLRAWQPGDRMRPLGMRGTRKLHDIFTDAKVPRHERRLVLVVTCKGVIVWVPGFRIAEGWQVRDPEKPAWQIRISKVR